MKIVPDVEDLALEWIISTSVADLLTKPNGDVAVFLGMPTGGGPLPCVTIQRVGGAPNRSSDVGEDNARISFACIAKSRAQSKEIAKTLVSEALEMCRTSGFVSADGRLSVAETLSWVFMPDILSKNARYVVDILFVATPL